MIHKSITWAVIALTVLLAGCAKTITMRTIPATLGYTTSVHKDLVSLPKPVNKIVVAVYNFRDQTGQYKPLPNVTSFSTAVTQGATSMLIQALLDSDWFIPVEREGFPDLLTERKIILQLSKVMENGKDKDKIDEGKGNNASLQTLLPAAILLEGGIIAYDTDIVTGGFGAKYFGLGGSTQLRKDQVTIYLRAVDPKSGRILDSITTTKSILSKEVDIGLYRFVRFNKLLEIESGLTTNEPPQMCVKEAIEKAVESLIVEGIHEKLWVLKTPGDINSPVIKSYFREKYLPLARDRFGRKRAAGVAKFDEKGNLISERKME